MTRRIESVTIGVAHLRDELKAGRPYEWWRRFTPLWLDVTLNADGSITFAPNGRHAGGSYSEPNHLSCRSMLAWVEGCPAFLSNAAVKDTRS